MVESLLSKLLGLKDGDFIKKWLQRRCFPVKFTKFLRTHILKNGCCYVFYLLWHHHLPAIEKKVQPSVLLKNMLVYRHPAGSTGNWRVKIFFWHIFLKKNFFLSQIYFPSYAYPPEQNKLLVLSSASFFNRSYCFEFSYPLSSAGFTRLHFTRPSNKPMEG